jgi:hypothetical protein
MALIGVSGHQQDGVQISETVSQTSILLATE